MIGSCHVHHDDKGECGSDSTTGCLGEEICDPLARHRLDGRVDKARREEAQHTVQRATAKQGGQSRPHETDVHRDKPLTVQPWAARNGSQAVSGLLKVNGLVANVVNE